MKYLTYEEYVFFYGGSVCDEATFARNIDRASAMIDIRTNSRFGNEDLFEDYQGALKLASTVCADLIDYISTNTVIKPMVTSRSESVGNVSESESYAVKTVDDYASDLDKIFEPLNSIYTKNGFKVTYSGALS